MKTAYFLVLLLALTLVPEPAEAWFFRSVRRLRFHPYHTIGCLAACKWFKKSKVCKACTRKRGLDVDTQLDEVQRGKRGRRADEVARILNKLDLNVDGFVELDEIAEVTDLKVRQPVVRRAFRKADKDHDGKLNLIELKHFYFKNKDELGLEEAFEDDEDDVDDVDDVTEAPAGADDVISTPANIAF